jgi:hypothetical protein
MSEMFRLAAFHLLLAPLLVSYLRCVFTDARCVMLLSHHDERMLVRLGKWVAGRLPFPRLSPAPCILL